MTEMTQDLSLLQPGQLIARGVCRLLASHDFCCLEEFVPKRGRRVDVMAIGPKGELWCVECKSSRADYMSDAKWQGYLEYCDLFFWAVDTDFPVEILPEDSGLILADAWGGEIVRYPKETKLAPARRKAMTLKLARDTARRLQGYRDPTAGGIL
ncbi:MmcB family DNA repair protein [Pseudooceanicola nitratireducens]|uniref:MmcB family DNA repair protein n=1 Tax=Pseudooceanicola nitratireducens TaxID=517719 RepID=UPI0023F05E44|nr:MmcB family DNA repair protein [Pseudooceanicola nitratireducens]